MPIPSGYSTRFFFKFQSYFTLINFLEFKGEKNEVIVTRWFFVAIFVKTANISLFFFFKNRSVVKISQKYCWTSGRVGVCRKYVATETRTSALRLMKRGGDCRNRGWPGFYRFSDRRPRTRVRNRRHSKPEEPYYRIVFLTKFPATMYKPYQITTTYMSKTRYCFVSYYQRGILTVIKEEAFQRRR